MLAHSCDGGKPAPTRDQPRDGQQDEWNRWPRRRSQIARPPIRIELRLELIEALEIVELFTQVENGGADLVPQRRQRATLQARERRHAEAEPAVALVAAPQHQLGEQQVHDVARRRRVVAHQVDRHLVPVLDLPEIGKRHDGAARVGRNRDPRARDVGLVEIAEGKALLVGLLVRDPQIGDLPQARHDGRDVAAVQDLQ